MKYISVHLYRKVIDHALAEGMSLNDFKDIPVPVDDLKDLQALPADDFFRLHEIIDQSLPPGFSVRVGQEMKIEDYGVLGFPGEPVQMQEKFLKGVSGILHCSPTLTSSR
jgi:hypothetical protein